MKTVPFKSVLDAIVRRHGLDPVGQIPQNTARAVTEYINERIHFAWSFWDWPDLTVTEERAFRQIWNATRQFLRKGPDGKPDEVFYIGDSIYYRVLASALSDPPIGTLPTDPAFFEVISPVDTYISYDQACRKRIGMVLGVYGSNPRLSQCGCTPLLSYRPSEKGIDVCNPTGPTVFVHYVIPESKFTIIPYVPGKSYVRDDIVYDPVTRDVFIAIVDYPVSGPSDAMSWSRMVFPIRFDKYVRYAAFADSLKDTDPTENDGPAWQVKMGRIAKAEQDAEDALVDEAKQLQIQGQKHFYGRWGWHFNGVCTTQPWPGGTVTTISDECETGGPVIPITPPPQITWEFHPEVVSIDGASLALIELPTLYRVVGSIVKITIGPSGDRQSSEWNLLTGPANPADGGQKTPNDYDATFNSKHWEKSG